MNKKLGGKFRIEERHRSHQIMVEEDAVTQRIDNFLFSKFHMVPRSRIYGMIRRGELRVNGGRVKQFYKLKLGDTIRIPPLSYAQEVTRKPGQRLMQLLLESIVFEDRKILVINKPVGIASHGGSGINFGAIEILRSAREDLKNLTLVHRLDRDTSGCLILAKRNSYLRELHRLMVARAMHKKYLLLVVGAWRGGKRQVDLPLVKNHLQSGERMVAVDFARGKDALTIFRPLGVTPTLSFLEAELKTGRTHQIRVHASSLGYPIVGDLKYGPREAGEEVKQWNLQRLCLHAHSMNFSWEDGEKASFKVPLDEKMASLVKAKFGFHGPE